MVRAGLRLAMVRAFGIITRTLVGVGGGPARGMEDRLRPERGESAQMVKVSATGNEPLDKVLKRFKKKCEKEGLIRDIKRSSYYEKPSERRRRKLRKMIKRARKALAEQKAYYGY